VRSRLPLAWRDQRTVLGFAFARSSRSSHRLIDAAVLEFGPAETLPPVGAMSPRHARLSRPRCLLRPAHRPEKPGCST